MNNAVINIRTDPALKKEAQNLAKKIGMPLSMAINHLLKRFVKTKAAIIDFSAEEPSEMLIQDLRESEKDRKAGKVRSFDSIDESMEFLRSMRNKK